MLARIGKSDRCYLHDFGASVFLKNNKSGPVAFLYLVFFFILETSSVVVGKKSKVIC